MKLTAKGRYAVTALLDMAIHQSDNDEPISITALAQRQNISSTYLEQLTSMLRQKGLLISVRGAKGGYRLAKAPEEITLAEIILAVEENLDTTQCKGKGNCMHETMCLTHHIWDALNSKISEFFNEITLQKLASEPAILAVAQRQRATTCMPI